MILPVRIVCTLLVLLPFVVTLLAAILGGSRKTWSYSLAKLLCVLGSALLAQVIALSVREPIGERLFITAESALDAELGGALTAMDTTGAVLKAMLETFLAPMVFLICFAVLTILSHIVVFVIFQSIKKRKEKSVSKQFFCRPGLWLGVARALLLSVILVMPLCGYLTLVSDSLYAFEMTGAMDTTMLKDDVDRLDLKDASDALSSVPLANGLNATVGTVFFIPLTTVDRQVGNDTLEINLHDELTCLAEGVGEVVSFTDRLDVIRQTGGLCDSDEIMLQRTRKSLMRSQLIQIVTADAVSNLADSWSRGRSFAGMERPEVDPLFRPTVNATLEILREETPELLEADLKTISDIAVALLNGGLLQDSITYTEMMDMLGGTGEGEDSLLSTVLALLAENSHTAPLVDEFNALSTRVVAKVLESSGLMDGKFDTALDEVAVTLDQLVRDTSMDKTRRSQIIQESVREAMAEHDDIIIPDDVAIAMCEKVMDDLSHEPTITGPLLKQYLSEHAADLAGDIVENLPSDLPDDFSDIMP